MHNAKLAWEKHSDSEHGQRILSYEPDIAAEIDGDDDQGGGEFSASDFRRMMAAFGPIFDFLLHRDQREGKPSEHLNSLHIIGQRALVMRHMTCPRASTFGNFADMARAWGVSRSAVGKHVRDWNAAFGIFGSNQKNRSEYEQGESPILRSKKYSEAAKRSHITRRFRRKADSLLHSSRNEHDEPNEEEGSTSHAP